MLANPNGERALNILFVEDEQPFFTLMQRMLTSQENKPYHLYWAWGMAEAARMLPELDPDSVLLDMFLPDSAGVDTVIRVRGIAPQVPILVLTGVGDEDLASEVLRHGA